MIPGKEAEDSVVFIYDIISNSLELENKIIFQINPTGIKLRDISDNNFIFDENKAKMILEELKIEINSLGFSLLQK
ncbi:hypothetical protein OGZ02_00080 [Brachyspira hyodysenteriae]|nr:hypothetical protein [Brachyspira hyodysenteriae]MDA1467275.1 hypothetical protein [Brachyspira hyodysenteriae]